MFSSSILITNPRFRTYLASLLVAYCVHLAIELSIKIAVETKEYLQRPRENSGRARLSGDAAPAAVARMYDELDALAAEKVALSGRLVQKFERVMARLQHDLQRVLELEGDEPGGLPPTREFLRNLEGTVRQISGLRAVAAQEMGIGSPVPVPPAAAGSFTSVPAAQKSKCLRGLYCITFALTYLYIRAEDFTAGWHWQGIALDAHRR